MRKAHRIQPNSKGLSTYAAVVVQAAVKQRYNSEGDDTGELVLADWRATFGDCKDGRIQFDGWSSGKVANAFWADLIKQTEHASECVIMTRYAREAAAALGLWDMILSDRACIRGNDPMVNRDDVPTATKGKGGVVILEGPPTIIRFGLEDTQCVYTWLDPANYGVSDSKLYQLAVDDGATATRSDKPEAWLDPEYTVAMMGHVRAWWREYVDTLRRLDLGGLENTAASQAMAAYRRTVASRHIIVHDNEAVIKMERAALFGGRCECRYIGTLVKSYLHKPPTPVGEKPDNVRCINSPIYHLDVNSLYPFVAGGNMLPCELDTCCRNVSVPTLLAACKAVGIIAQVTVDVRSPVVPVIHDKATLYPIGRFTTTLCGPEILLAAEYGNVLSCHVAAVYKMRPLYADWVKRLYAARMSTRQAGNTAMDCCIKSVLNASFGKWAQKKKQWTEQPDDICPWPFYQWWQEDRTSGEQEQWRSFAWSVQRMVDAGEPAESCPAITAYINSLARVQLWRDMDTAGQENIYYYDTDSLWVNSSGYNRLHAAFRLSNGELGGYKRAGEHDRVTFYGHKRYSADGQLTLAGCPSPAAKSGDAFALCFKSPPVGHYLLHADPPGLDRHTVKVKLHGAYTLGNVQPCGTVTPVVFVNGETQ
jgi:hypothetical protein